MDRAEILACAVGTAEGVGKIAHYGFVHGFEPSLWEHGVGVENEQILPFGLRGAVVAGKGGAFILPKEILDLEVGFILSHNVFALDGRAVFDHDYLEIGVCLTGKTREKFADLVRSVVDRYDY